MNDVYKHKYIKYKMKYLEAKKSYSTKMIGGGSETFDVFVASDAVHESNVRKSLDELKQSIITIVNEFKCCYIDFIKSYDKIKNVYDFCKENNIDFNQIIELNGKFASQISLSTQYKLVQQIIPFFAIVEPLMKNVYETIQSKVNINSIRAIGNNIPMSNVYDHFIHNYLGSVTVICNAYFMLGKKMISQILQNNKMPYFKLNVVDRLDFCDKQVQIDCLLLTLSQKIARFILPVDELLKTLKLKESWSFQYSQIKQINDGLKKDLLATNDLVRLLEKQTIKVSGLNWIEISLKQFDSKEIETKLASSLFCKQCETSGNVKQCCSGLCKKSGSSCKYSPKQPAKRDDKGTLSMNSDQQSFVIERTSPSPQSLSLSQSPSEIMRVPSPTELYSPPHAFARAVESSIPTPLRAPPTPPTKLQKNTGSLPYVSPSQHMHRTPPILLPPPVLAKH